MNKQDEKELVALTISGFKSIFSKQVIGLGALTLLSGANSSGKTSVTQALLLLKQTIEAAYDPGALLLNGPNLRLTSANQLLAKSTQVMRATFSVGLTFSDDFSQEIYFRRHPEAPGGFELSKVKLTYEGRDYNLTPNSTGEEIRFVHENIKDRWSPFRIFESHTKNLDAKLERNRCNFEVSLFEDTGSSKNLLFKSFLPNSHRVDQLLQELIHVPGLRGNPERTYTTTAVGKNFPGRFETYVASIIKSWQDSHSKKFEDLNFQLQYLGLTASLTTQKRNDTEVEIRVSRQKSIASAKKIFNLVSIADVGFGVSQILPVLVALLVAEKHQMVIIEQPELHLHPRAQTKMAEIVTNAVNRGVRVVIETHSSLLLLGIQTAVANGALKSNQIVLNWFSTNENGHTRVSVGDIDEFGTIGGWPTDFMDVRLDAESAYLDAVEKKISETNG